MAIITAICVSKKKGEKKQSIDDAVLLNKNGIEGDAHAGDWHRQISLLSEDSVATIRNKGLDLSPGDFAENILVQGIKVADLPVGARLGIADKVELEITQIGKECHNKCAIYEQVGDCIMPREGVFARVLKEGYIKAGDPIEVVGNV